MVKRQQRQTISVKQGIAISALVEGRSINEAARAAGVHRVTVSNWKRSDYLFIASLNSAREELLRQHGDELRTIRSQALRCVRGAVENGNLKAALEVLRLTSRGTTGVAEGVGPSDPKVLEVAYLLAERIHRVNSGEESALLGSVRKTTKQNTRASTTPAKEAPKKPGKDKGRQS